MHARPIAYAARVTSHLSVAVVGAHGRMGRAVCDAVDGAPDLELVARLDASDDVAGLAGGPAQVAVDFTVPSVTEANVHALLDAGLHVVVGTTGWTEESLGRVRDHLEELSSGRTFTALTAHTSQGGRRRASGTLLLDVTARDVIRHAAPAPACPGPYDSEPYDMSVTGRDLRMVDGAYTDDPDAPVGPPVIDTWVRYREVPADPCLHAALLAHFTGHISIVAALRPHAGIGQRQAHRTLSTGINAISISIHADVRADRWMRYHHLSTFAGDGMTHSECRVYTEADELIASFTVDAMVRGFAHPGAAVDEKTAL